MFCITSIVENTLSVEHSDTYIVENTLSVEHSDTYCRKYAVS